MPTRRLSTRLTRLTSNAPQEELVAPYRLPTSREGLTRFYQMLDELIACHTPKAVLLGHEPTGVYHEPWARALMARYQPHLEGPAFPPSSTASSTPTRSSWPAGRPTSAAVRPASGAWAGLPPRPPPGQRMGNE